MRAPGAGSAVAAPVTGGEQASYDAAFNALKGGDYQRAISGFRNFVATYPDSSLASNAQYWLGECFYGRQQFTQAAPEFRAVVSRYPAGNKAPDALLKLGYCMIAAGDTQKGRDILRSVPTTYPRTDAARLAESRLAELEGRKE